LTTVESDAPVVAVAVNESVEPFSRVVTPAESFGVAVNVDVSPEPTLAEAAESVKVVGATAIVQATVVV
jgi:ribosomal protein S12 methylthiotransferase accessory factor YcaO